MILVACCLLIFSQKLIKSRNPYFTVRIPFEVSPKCLKRFTGEIDTIPVVAVGDALISAEYRYGTGIENGVAEAYMLTSSLRLSGTKITIDENAWLRQPINIPRYREGNVAAVFGEHKRRICQDYESKNRILQQAREEAYMRFKENPLEASGFDKSCGTLVSFVD